MATITVTKDEEKAPLLDVEHLAAPNNSIIRRRTCDGTHFDEAISPLLSTTSAIDTTSSGLSTQTTTGASSAAGGDVSALRRQNSDSNLLDRREMKRKQSSKLTSARNVNLAPINVRPAASQPPISKLAYTDTPITQFMKEVSYSQKPSVASNISAAPSFNTRQDSKDSLLDILDIRIFFPEGRSVQFAVEGGAFAEVSDLLELMAEHMKLEEADVYEAFSIWFVSPLLEVQLKPHHVAAQIRLQWPHFLRKFTTADEGDVLLDNPLLVFKRNVSLNLDRELVLAQKHPKILEVLYRDAKCSYLDGRYIVDVEIALELAALQLAADYGPYKSDEQMHTLIQKKLPRVVPQAHYDKIRSFHLFGIHFMECSQGLEADLMQAYKDYSTKYPNKDALRTAYLDLLRQTPFYGAAFFSGLIDRKTTSSALVDLGKRFFTGHHPLARMSIRIGIQQEFVTVVDLYKHDVLLTLRIDECTWFKDDESLLLHFPEPESMATVLSLTQSTLAAGEKVPMVPMTTLLLAIFSFQSPMMADLLDGLSNLSDNLYSSAHSVATPASPAPTNLATSDYSDGNMTDSSTASSAPAPVSQTSRFSRESGERSPVLVSENKLNRLCLAKIDPKGRCVEAHGFLKRLLTVQRSQRIFSYLI